MTFGQQNDRLHYKMTPFKCNQKPTKMSLYVSLNQLYSTSKPDYISAPKNT